MRGRVKRMDSLVEGILQYSRVSRLEGQYERADLGALVHEVVDDLGPPAGVELMLQESWPTLEVRRLRLKQVLANLVTNAVKYHDKKGHGAWVKVAGQLLPAAASTSRWPTTARASPPSTTRRSSRSSRPCSRATRSRAPGSASPWWPSWSRTKGAGSGSTPRPAKGPPSTSPGRPAGQEAYWRGQTEEFSKPHPTGVQTRADGGKLRT